MHGHEAPPGAECAVHSKQGDELVTAVLGGMHQPGGINVCPDCIARAKRYLRKKTGLDG